MARNRRSLLSDSTKLELARIQGAGDRVQPGDYGGLTSKEAGNLVKLAIAVAEQTIATNSPQIGGRNG